MADKVEIKTETETKTKTETDPEKFSVTERLLYKQDRTIAIFGIIALGVIALFDKTPDSKQIAIAAVGGLIGYLGGRTGK